MPSSSGEPGHVWPPPGVWKLSTEDPFPPAAVRDEVEGFGEGAQAATGVPSSSVEQMRCRASGREVVDECQGASLTD